MGLTWPISLQTQPATAYITKLARATTKNINEKKFASLTSIVSNAFMVLEKRIASAGYVAPGMV